MQAIFIWAYSDKDISYNDSCLITVSYESPAFILALLRFLRCGIPSLLVWANVCVFQVGSLNLEWFPRLFGRYVFPIDFATCVDDNDPTDLTGVPVHDGTCDGLIICTLQLSWPIARLTSQTQISIIRPHHQINLVSPASSTHSYKKEGKEGSGLVGTVWRMYMQPEFQQILKDEAHHHKWQECHNIMKLPLSFFVCWLV